MSVVLGVDGGNTKTLAVVADADGRTCGAGAGGQRGHLQRRDAGRRRSRRSRRRSREALGRGGHRRGRLDAATFSLAGADWPEDFALLERALHERLGLRRRAARRQRRARRAARRLARLDRRSRSSRAPTTRSARAAPTAACSTSASGPTARAGATSAATALRAVYRAALGMGPATALTERALALYGAGDAIDLLHEFTRRGGLAEARGRPARAGRARRRRRRRRGRARDRRREGPHRSAARAARAPRSSACRSTGTRVVLSRRRVRASDRAAGRRRDGRAAGRGRRPRIRPPPVAGALLLALDRSASTSTPTVAAACRPRLDGRSAPWAGSPSRA